MDGLQAGELAIDVAEHEDGLELTWRGKSNDHHPGKILAPFFAQVLDRASAGAQPVTLRFEDLEHFNSSTIGALIDLIDRARRQQVPLVMTYDGDLGWQRVSFEALRVFVKDDGLLDLRADGARS
jgi:hypothetical protein